jgi:hypothetical protein
MSRMPSCLNELAASPPSAWIPTLEKLVMRSMSFSECEMISHPVLILTVVSTTEIDTIAAMQELSSNRHNPPSMMNGQYDTDVDRVYLLIHDAHCTPTLDINILHRRLQGRFPPSRTKLLILNSLSPDSPNLQQPDMFSHCINPLYFSNLAPRMDKDAANINPFDGSNSLGSHLSMEDFMAIREFCVNMYTNEIIPALERRVNSLTKLVNENRKGMKNVFKSFWRKPRDDSTSPLKGQISVRYRYDRIEQQILLLADTCFIIKDYETASSWYKLVKDDYKSDKSTLHLAHTQLMMAACTMLFEPGRKDLIHQLDTLGQILMANPEPVHSTAYFSLLASEMYVYHHSTRSPVEAAHLLLQAAVNVSKYSLLCGLLTEKAAAFFLKAGYSRKFSLHQVLAGHKIHSCGIRPAKHSAICFATAMIVYDDSHWGDAKAKLARALAENLKLNPCDDGKNKVSERSFLLILRVLGSVVNKGVNITGKDSSSDAVLALKELMREGPWGSIAVGDGWAEASTYNILLGPVPVNPLQIADTSTTQKTEIFGLAIPELDKSSLSLMQPVNGMNRFVRHGSTSTELAVIDELYEMLQVEKIWIAEQQLRQSYTTANDSDENKSLAEKLVEAEFERLNKLSGGGNNRNMKTQALLQIALGEKIIIFVTLHNKLPTELNVSDLKLDLDPIDSFQVDSVDLNLVPGQSQKVKLTAVPLEIGSYIAKSATWNLSKILSIKQSLQKDGPLLQKTLLQRMSGDRGNDLSMNFNVVKEHPLLNIKLEGLSSEVLQGQLLKTSLIIRNEGCATACDIFLKLSKPCFVFYLYDSSSNSSELIPSWGHSSSVVKLPAGTVIEPGQELRLSSWIQMDDFGKQNISVLASYLALRENGDKVALGPDNKCRTSFINVETVVLPSISVTVKTISRPSSTTQSFLLMNLCNSLPSFEDFEQTNRASTRHSSIGQFEIEDVPEYCNQLEEGCCRVEGVWMLGAAQPSENSESLLKSKGLILESSENLTMSLQVDLNRNEKSTIPSKSPTDSHPSAVYFSTGKRCQGDGSSLTGTCSWALSMDTTNMNTVSEASPAYLKDIMERFLIIRKTNRKHQAALHTERLKHLSDALLAEVEGPRSITAVRKDNKDDKKNEGNMQEIGLENDGELKDERDSEIERTSDVNDNISTTIGVPMNALEVASYEATTGSIAIAVVWACKWQGKIRRGIHYTFNISMLSTDVTTVNVSKNPQGSRFVGSPSRNIVNKIPNISELVLVSITHPSSIHSSEAKSSVHVPVVVELRSASKESMAITVEAIDRRTVSNNDKKSNSTHHKGLRWEYKTKYVDVNLPSQSSVKLSFTASLPKTGVFDLKR